MKAKNDYQINEFGNLPISVDFDKFGSDAAVSSIQFSAESQEFLTHNPMPQTQVKRLDHFGIIAGIIKRLEIVETIDNMLGCDEQEHISKGEAVAGMILNGLGYTNRPLMLTPQFYENKAMTLLFREGVKAEHFNKHKLGRALDSISEFGSTKLFSIVALNACKIEDVNLNNAHNDTTSHSVSGRYEKDTYSIKPTYGHSKDNKPGNKQFIQELMVTEDGGIPFVTQVFSGNKSDNVIFRERVKIMRKEFAKSTNRCLVADSKLLTKKSAYFLKSIYFVTRIAGPTNAEKNAIIKALKTNSWVDVCRC